MRLDLVVHDKMADLLDLVGLDENADVAILFFYVCE